MGGVTPALKKTRTHAIRMNLSKILPGVLLVPHSLPSQVQPGLSRAKDARRL
jgi:hypothetical protein